MESYKVPAVMALLFLGFFDQFPILSQLESAGRAICGDIEGARECQEKFLRVGIISSQINSAVLSATGNNEEARKVQEEFGMGAANMVAGVPVVGYIPSAVAAAVGDEKLAKEFAKTCTKSTMMAGLAAVTVATGGAAGVVLAAGAGVAASFGADAVITGVESAIEGKYCPNGNLATVHAIVDASQKGEPVGELIAGGVISLAGDCASGMGTRTSVKVTKTKMKIDGAVKKSVKETTLDHVVPPSNAPRPPLPTKKQAKGNLNRGVKETKGKGKQLSDNCTKDSGSIHCTMEGSGGTKGSGSSYKADPSSTSHKKATNAIDSLDKEIKSVQKDTNKLIKEAKDIERALEHMEKKHGSSSPQCKSKADRLHELDGKIVENHFDMSIKTEEIKSHQLATDKWKQQRDALHKDQGIENHRHGLGCGENPAAQPIINAGEQINTSSAFRLGKKGQVYGAERCRNTPNKPGCESLKVGAVPTDFLHGVKLNPGKKKIFLTTGYLVDGEVEKERDHELL